MSRPIPRLVAAALVVVLCSIAASGAQGEEQRPGSASGLSTGTPESVGLDPAVLEELSRQIAAKKKHKLHSLLVLRHGVLVFEEYYNGYTAHDLHDMRSATKSITSLLTGIAIEQGLIKGVDVPVMSVLGESYPEVRDKGDITLRHLLTMSNGLDCDDGDRKTRG